MKNFQFKKRYGQNFLKNKEVINKIVTSIKPTEKDLIIEIGPGSGVITRELKKYHCNIIAYEIDTETSTFLKDLEDEKTKIIYKDFLNTNILEDIEQIEYEKLYFVGNLPYYITTPIVDKIIDSNIKFESLTIMIQKEVADRFTASVRTKNYGYMTVKLNYWFDIDKITNVSKADFVPVPKVDSSVLKLTYNPKSVKDYNKFNNIIKEMFCFKRKTINNNIKTYDKEKVKDILSVHGFDLTNRAEEIDLETYIDLANNL